MKITEINKLIEYLSELGFEQFKFASICTHYTKKEILISIGNNFLEVAKYDKLNLVPVNTIVSVSDLSCIKSADICLHLLMCVGAISLMELQEYKKK